MKRILAQAALACLALACAGPRPAPLPLPPAAAAPAVRANRDPKGPPAVEDYVARLESPERLAEMRPDFVVEQLALAPDAWIADIGCGPGVFALRLARAAPRGIVFAVDVEPAQLDRLREHLLEAQVENVVPVLASLGSPHLPPARFDLVFLGDTYHHLQDRVAYMGALRGLLKGGGRLAIFEYKPGDLPVGPPADHKLPPGEMESELRAAGWELSADVKSHDYHDFQVWRPAPGSP